MKQAERGRAKLIVAVAPVGPPDDPGPTTPAEVADAVAAAWEAGASIVHLHVRDERGQQTTRLEAFDETIRRIRSRCDIIIEGSTGGPTHLSFDERSVALQADGLELASLNVGSVNFDDSVYVNTRPEIWEWARRIQARGIKPDCSVFDLSMLNTVAELQAQGLLVSPALVAFSMGFHGAIPATPAHLATLMAARPADSAWVFLEHGHRDLTLHAAAIGLGGHVRVGFEDSHDMGRGRRAASNAELVAAIVRIAHEAGREVATPAEARRMLGLAGA